MVYLGSKNKLAKYIVPIIQKYIDDTNCKDYFEPFVGGANIIDKIKCENKYGNDINKYLIEIKPTKYMILPKEPKLSKSTTDANKLEKFRKKKINFDMTTMDVMVNAAKWNAAEVWCKNRGVNWLILNEKNVGNLFKQ